jgi:hypothetical protein
MRSHLSCGLSPRRPGGVTPVAVLSISLLIGVVAIAVDGGTLMEHRRHVQATADAAALAAAADLYTNYASNKGADPSNTASNSALPIAAANGFNNDGVNSTVTVSVSPQSYQDGPNKGQPLPAGYAEVIIQYNAGRMFSNVFGPSAIPVRARAVARGRWAADNDKVIALNLNASGSVTVSGSAGLKILGILQVNSSSSTALNVTGSLSASQINLNSAGGLIGSSLSLLFGLVGSGPPPVHYGSPIPDPLRFLPDPDPVKLALSTRSASKLTINSGTVDLYPGVYVGGIAVNGLATVTLHANSDGTPGIYYLQGGGLKLGMMAKVTTAAAETAGVMIYNDWQASGDCITTSGMSSLTLSPPASGIYEGLSIFQARGSVSTSAPTLTVSGSGLMSVSGTIYGAYANLTVSGGASGSVVGGQIIVDTLTVSGSATINVDPGTKPIANCRAVGLVE